MPGRGTVFFGVAPHGTAQAPRAVGAACLHDVQRRRQRGQPACHGAPTQEPQPAGPSRQVRTPHHQRGAILQLRLRDQFHGRIATAEHGCNRPQFFGQLDHRQDPVALRDFQPLQAGCFDVHRVPTHIELARQPGSRAHGLLSAFVRAYAGQDGPLGVPDRSDGLFNTVAAHVVFNVLGGAPQRYLAQGNQVALAKEVLRRTLGLVRQVDLTGLQARHQFVGRDIHQDDFIRIVQHRVRYRLMHPDAGDGAHRAIEAFQMLNIQRRPDIDAGLQQFLHVLPAFGMARALDVTVRQLIHQQHPRLARQRSVQVKLLEQSPPVRHIAQRQGLKPRQQFCRVVTAVCFDHSHQHITARPALALGGAEHGVGFTHASAGAKINAQLAAARTRFVTAQLLQQLVRVGTIIRVIGHQVSACASGGTCKSVTPWRRPAADLLSASAYIKRFCLRTAAGLAWLPDGH
ncbi:hypothetical protein D9M73_53380 [compost metagenome]